MVDNNAHLERDMTAPADDAFEIVPHATDELEQVTRSVYVGTTGNLDVVMKSGRSQTFPSVPAGTTLHIRVVAVRATSTAGGLVGMV